MSELSPTRGAKMLYLIKRRATTSREELVAHWFANHMPQVIRSQTDQRNQARLHAWRYIATLFEPNSEGEHPWDGVAALWWDRPLPVPAVAHGTEPTDTFQAKAQPYLPWGTTEYVVVDGTERLSTEPLTLNEPYPMTRSGFYKVTFLVRARPATDFQAFFDHWLGTHVPNVSQVLARSGGFRYVVSHSLEPQQAHFAGMAELYFADAAGWREYLSRIQPDGMEQWVADEGTLVLKSHTEMVGIP